MTLRILLADDSPSDVRHTHRSFRGYDVLIDVAGDGLSALQKVRAGTYDVLLLDLNLPRIRGDEVLRRLKADPLTRSLPVVVLTSSDDQVDIERAYDLQCSAYLTKPITPAKFQSLAATFEGWWVLVQLPDKPP